VLILVAGTVAFGGLLLAAAWPAGAQDNLLTNASFEATRVPPGRNRLVFRGAELPGWQVTAGSVTVTPYWWWEPADGQGRQSLALGEGGPASIEQRFDTEPGREYVVSGWVAHDPDLATAEGQLTLSVNGELLTTVTHADPEAIPAEMRWVLFARRFQATAAKTTLTITGDGAVLDGLAVRFTPWAPTTGSFFHVDLLTNLTHRLYDSQLNSPGNDLSYMGDSLTPESPLLELNGIPFRPEGVVLVGPGETEGRLTQGPATTARQVEGILVGRKALRLYFLHATNFTATTGARVGTYIVHYADGSRVQIPLRAGIELADWWNYPTSHASAAPTVWRGRSPGGSRWDRTVGFKAIYGKPLEIQLYQMTWENPSPEREIQSLDMLTGDQSSGFRACAPFLVAVSGQ
jgi:hypothetical protein